MRRGRGGCKLKDVCSYTDVILGVEYVGISWNFLEFCGGRRKWKTVNGNVR